jgi:hypothetical protein
MAQFRFSTDAHFRLHQMAANGEFVAECLSESIFTQANTWEELHHNVQEATSAFFYDGAKPSRESNTSCTKILKLGTSHSFTKLEIPEFPFAAETDSRVGGPCF